MIWIPRLSLLGVRGTVCKMTLVTFLFPFHIYLQGNLSKKKKKL